MAVSMEVLALLAVFLLGYALGRRLGRSQGQREGQLLAPLELRKSTLEKGYCLICGSRTVQNPEPTTCSKDY